MAENLYAVSAVVLNGVARLTAVKFLLSYGILALAGTLMACWVNYKDFFTTSEDRQPQAHQVNRSPIF